MSPSGDLDYISDSASLLSNESNNQLINNDMNVERKQPESSSFYPLQSSRTMGDYPIQREKDEIEIVQMPRIMKVKPLRAPDKNDKDEDENVSDQDVLPQGKCCVSRSFYILDYVCHEF